LPGFEFGISHPESVYRDALLARFPRQQAAIAGWFDACNSARRSAFTLFALHGMPAWMSWGLRLWRGAEAENWARHTVADELTRIDEPLLRAVLGARWADYGAAPAQAPLVVHALVTGVYNAGSYYPVGGPSRFAQALVPVIEAAGGEVRLQADVKHIITHEGRARGVEFELQGERRQEEARHIVSAIGVATPSPASMQLRRRHGSRPSAPWRPASPTCRCSSVGERHRAAGAGTANHWIYEVRTSAPFGAARRTRMHQASSWRSPRSRIPPARSNHLAEIVATVDAAHSRRGSRFR
jgi:all-trans-retinol 13,14-reductase